MVLRSAARGRATVSLELKRRHLQYQGIAHGGLLTALADTAATFACNSALRLGQDSVTLELKMNFLAPVRSGTISARARLLHRGRRTTVAQVEVIDSTNRMICAGLFTMLITGEATG